MNRFAAAVFCGFLIQPLAHACDIGKPEVIAAGQHFLAVEQQFADVGGLFNAAKTEYDTLIEDVEETGGYDDWEDDAEYLLADMQTYNSEWEIADRLLVAADADLKAALGAHEAACGADAQADAILAELGISKNP